MKKIIANTMIVVGTVFATTAVVAPVTYTYVKRSAIKYVSVEQMFRDSAAFKTLAEEDKEKMLRSYQGLYVQEGSELFKQYDKLFNPKKTIEGVKHE